ncbi:MAG: hypothetical protein KVP17_002682 [Porospora cf. gigantea B]|uniref:uncharacterized protein n=1 Tax=Porospora cf. gigantea B TaxID=2853592 RepID=UPI003571D3A3|nr:MAG: hypothetical protein KVP17_002682 [Porospora cf. gigantea B]
MPLHSNTVRLLGLPFARGQRNAGPSKAPEALRAGGLEDLVRSQGLQFQDCGDVLLPEDENEPTNSPRKEVTGCSLFKLFESVCTTAASGDFVLNVGGDHSVGFATLMGMKTQYPDLRVIWVDAHGDCNTPETSQSGNYHGMPAAHAMGWFKEQPVGFEWAAGLQYFRDCEIAFLGLRDVDQEERELLRIHSDVVVSDMHSIDRHGIHSELDRIVKRLDPDGVYPLHVSFDIDACDPAIAPGTGTLARGGLNYRESHYILEYLSQHSRLVSLDIVEVDPTRDLLRHRMHGDHKAIRTDGLTQYLALDLIRSALGGTIL